MTAREKAASLKARFEAAGAEAVDLPVLLPAETLLDLYGEDIRGRAYVTTDALRGEMMLRPDFTVPVVEKHMANGVTTARYTYAGEIFRRQDDHPDRPNEYLQVGYEFFGGPDPAAADAEVFTLFADMVAPLNLRAVTGDISVLMAAVCGLRTSDARKAALMRHIWRPRRFRALLDRFGGRAADRPSPFRQTDGPLTGLRTQAEIDARLDALKADAQVQPISKGELAGFDALLNVRETVPYALQQMQDIAVDLPAIEPALHSIEARAEALGQKGIPVDDLAFEASYGRTSMEYYDGFVFGFHADQRPELPPVATGGRYDALTQRLGKGGAVPAVGGVVRPGLMVQLEAGI